jgi:carboxymethylenebutenolidase
MNETDGVGRREFMVNGLGAGFALAALPVSAWAITTGDEGIVAGPVEIPTEGGPMPGYRAQPKGKGPFPAVLVVHEIFGVHAYLQDICRRLAKAGYATVCPYLYFREGDVTRLKEIEEIRSKVVSKVSPDRVMSDLDATVKWLGSGKAADLRRLGITGFCWGGTAVWTYSAHNPRLKAGVAWYGRLVGTPLKPPVEIAEKLSVPVLGLYGAKDKGIPLEDVEMMRAALARGKSGSEIVVYPEAEHGFHADYRPTYHEPSAKDGWERMLAWFRKNRVA